MGVRKRAGRSGVEGGFGVDHPIGGRGVAKACDARELGEVLRQSH
jgi:hypothetical protein